MAWRPTSCRSMASAIATVNVDEQGRVVIPKAAREKLGIDGQAATVEVEVRHE